MHVAMLGHPAVRIPSPTPRLDLVRGRRRGIGGSVARSVLIGAVVVIVAGVVGVLSAGDANIAMLIAFGVLGAGLAVVDPMLVVALALPATLLMARVGGLLSVSDFVLAAATVLSLVFVPAREMVPLRTLIWAGVAYLAAALPTTVLNPFGANIVEWIHEAVLVIGSLVVGFAIGRSGRTRLAVGVYIWACIGIAIAATIVGVFTLATEGTFGPVYLPELHKNTIGGALAAALVILYGRPAWFRWPLLWSWVAIGACGVGILASGSRQGMVGAIVGMLVISLRRRPETGRFPKLAWIAAIPVTIAVMTLVEDQLSEDNPFNSAYQRLDWYAQSIEIWLQSPIFGVGLRWWYTGEYAAFQPPNAELEVLTSVGVVGLIGFLAMFLIAIVALWRIDPAYGTVGVAIIMTRFTQGQFDLYWVAGQASFLWIIAGICVGSLALDRLRAERDALGLATDPEHFLRMAPARTAPARTRA